MHGCEKCARLDSTLRGAEFTYAVSFLIVTLRRSGSAGVFCGGCRKREAFKYSLLSALVGWWGIPWGPIYTLQTIGKNSAGGYQDGEFNADLLAAVGAELADQGDQAEAIKCLEKSLEILDQAEVRQFLWALHGSATTVEERPAVAQPLGDAEGSKVHATTSQARATFGPGDLVAWHTSTPLRREPLAESEIIVSLDPEEAIVTRVSGAWAQVRAINGQSGWMPTSAMTKNH